jgi:hypothetical protein
MTRHSNMVVFGTNTSLGIRVGTSATSVPEIQVGYSRQEAVAIPVVANVANVRSADGSSDILVPCDLSQPVTVTGGAQFAVHPCSLVAVNGGAMDSYSVLASFGANFDASQSTTATAKGGLAQYFATGMAAQLLALNGGASVVAVGEAARESAAHPPSPGAVRSLFGNPVAFGVGAGMVGPYETFETTLLARLDAATDDADLVTKLKAFEQAAGIPVAARIADDCGTKAACRAEILGDAYGQIFLTRRTQMEAALGQWH